MRFLIVTLLALSLSGCGALKTFSALTGGGPNVAANVQAGKTNSQTVGTTENTSQKIVRPQARDIRQSKDSNSVRSDSVETVVVNQIPTWLLVSMAAIAVLFGAVGWLSPQPKWLKRKKANP
jgi:uncharacterized protein YceK